MSRSTVTPQQLNMFVSIRKTISHLFHHALRSWTGLLRSLLLLFPILRKNTTALAQVEAVESYDKSREEPTASPVLRSERPQSLSHRILDILEKYCLPGIGGQRQPLRSVEKFVRQVEQFILNDEPVHMVLPAFPFKSANKTTKVLGPLPDKGEEEALRQLNDLCGEIKKIHSPGARMCIVSDGLVYNGKS